MSTEELISVVIPVYNEEKRVARAIRSMQEQTYKNLEIIVVDDGSTDKTKTIVEEIAQQDPRVRLLTNKRVPKRTNWRGYDINAGFAARNYGFKEARGAWITTQDADDASLLNRIETQYRFAKKYQATMVTIQWMALTESSLGKQLNVEKLVQEKGEENLLIKPVEIVARAEANRGILMREPLHRFIPFSIKWFPYTRKLFFRRQDTYPGADNSMLFHRKVVDDGVLFRPRDERTWGTPSGRGSGRDFAYRVAATYKNSYSLKLPMYLWDVSMENTEYPGYSEHLI